MKPWMRFGPRDRRALVLGAAILAPALAFNLAVRPYLRTRADLKARVEEQRGLLRREQALLAQARALPLALRDAQHALAVARPRLFPGGDPFSAAASLVSVVGEHARQHGVLIESIESRAPEPIDSTDPIDAGLVAVRIDVRGRTDLEGLLRWLAALERDRRLLRVDQLGIGRLDGGVPGTDSLDVETLAVAVSVRGFLLTTPGNARDDAVAVGLRP